MGRKKYLILEANDAYELEDTVNEAIRDGYTPIGGMSATRLIWDDVLIEKYYQALILIETN